MLGSTLSSGGSSSPDAAAMRARSSAPARGPDAVHASWHSSSGRRQLSSVWSTAPGPRRSPPPWPPPSPLPLLRAPSRTCHQAASLCTVSASTSAGGTQRSAGCSLMHAYRSSDASSGVGGSAPLVAAAAPASIVFSASLRVRTAWPHAPWVGDGEAAATAAVVIASDSPMLPTAARSPPRDARPARGICGDRSRNTRSRAPPSADSHAPPARPVPAGRPLSTRAARHSSTSRRPPARRYAPRSSNR
eukprot:353857-Chlamydomonas_euryale.AAC.4